MKRKKFFWEEDDAVYFKNKVNRIVHEFSDPVLDTSDKLKLFAEVKEALYREFQEYKEYCTEEAHIVNEGLKEHF